MNLEERNFNAASIDTNIFLCLAFQDHGWRYCGKFLEDVYFGRIECIISSIQLSELYTPFKRAGDERGLNLLNIAILSSEYRSTIRTLENEWLSLADSIILCLY